MKPGLLRASLMALPILLAPTLASAGDPSVDATWRAYGGDGQSASVLVVDKSEADEPEAHYHFFMSCTTAEQWMMNVSDIDPKILGKAIADGGQPTFGLVLDGKSEVDDGGGYFPDIIFNQMDAVWEYSTNWDLGMVDAMLAAGEIGVRGTGVELKLPTDGMKTALTKFKSDCEALRGSTDEGETGDEPVIEEPGDDTAK